MLYQLSYTHHGGHVAAIDECTDFLLNPRTALRAYSYYGVFGRPKASPVPLDFPDFPGSAGVARFTSEAEASASGSPSSFARVESAAIRSACAWASTDAGSPSPGKSAAR